MKGIILAGGSGTRLYPATLETSKQLMPVYDKPMIYYPLATLMSLGIKEILIISTARDLPRIENLLLDGSKFGIKLQYKVQDKPNGIAESFILGEEFIAEDSVCLILGDNIYSGPDFANYGKLQNINDLKEGGLILAYHVNDPERYGVAEFNRDGKVLSIEEKPQTPKSNWAVTGLYFYDNNVIDIAKNLTPSARGELEITDINNIYLEQGKLEVELLRRGFAWLDTGTPDSLLDAANYVQTIQKRQGRNLACLEEIAYRKNFINLKQLEELAGNIKKGNAYGDYLRKLVDDIKNIGFAA